MVVLGVGPWTEADVRLVLFASAIGALALGYWLSGEWAARGVRR